MSYRQVLYRRALEERGLWELLDAEGAEPVIDVAAESEPRASASVRSR
jgi:hypothetical protein